MPSAAFALRVWEPGKSGETSRASWNRPPSGRRYFTAIADSMVYAVAVVDQVNDALPPRRVGCQVGDQVVRPADFERHAAARRPADASAISRQFLGAFQNWRLLMLK